MFSSNLSFDAISTIIHVPSGFRAFLVCFATLYESGILWEQSKNVIRSYPSATEEEPLKLVAVPTSNLTLSPVSLPFQPVYEPVVWKVYDNQIRRKLSLDMSWP